MTFIEKKHRISHKTRRKKARFQLKFWLRFSSIIASTISTTEDILIQAQRGIARQRAMQDGKYRRGNQTNNENTSHNFHEKESSKDSAYGYSGGENSRLATREPTPDAWQIKQQERTVATNFTHVTFTENFPETLND